MALPIPDYVPEGGWTQANFRGNRGRLLLRAWMQNRRILERRAIKDMRTDLRAAFTTLEKSLFSDMAQYHLRTNGKASGQKVVIDVEGDERAWLRAIQANLEKFNIDITVRAAGTYSRTARTGYEAVSVQLGHSPTKQELDRISKDGLRLAQRVTGITQTTRDRLEAELFKAREDELTLPEAVKYLRKKFPQIAYNRIPTIARTEMGRLLDHATVKALKGSSMVLEVSVVGCEAIEPDSPTYKGIPTCNIQGVPVEDADKLEFHINHTGAIIASKFREAPRGSAPTPEDTPVPVGGEEVPDPVFLPTPRPASPPIPSMPSAPQGLPRSPVVPMVEDAAEALIEEFLEAKASRGEISSASFDAFRKKYDSLLRTHFGVSYQELADGMAKALEESESYMGLDYTTLSKILKDGGEGKFKNSLETGRGTFKTIGEERAVRERGFFGITADTKDHDLWPKYGFMSGRDAMDTEGVRDFGYGDTYVRFKRGDVRHRSTITVGDSFNSNHRPSSMVSPAMDAQNPDAGKGGALYYYDRVLDSAEAAEKDGTSIPEHLKKEIQGLANGDRSAASSGRGVEYIETQIYGALKVENVEEIHTGSRKAKEAIEKELKKAKLPIVVKPLQFDPRLTSMKGAYLESPHTLSLIKDDVARLSDSYIHITLFSGEFSGQLSPNWDSGWVVNMPDEMKALRVKLREGLGTGDEARRYLGWYLDEREKKGEGILSKTQWEGIRSSLTKGGGWTKDVLNEALLKEEFLDLAKERARVRLFFLQRHNRQRERDGKPPVPIPLELWGAAGESPPPG
jgi:hypothetical protein